MRTPATTHPIMDKIWQRTQETRGFIYTRGNDKQDIPGNKQRTNQEKTTNWLQNGAGNRKQEKNQAEYNLKVQITETQGIQNGEHVTVNLP